MEGSQSEIPLLGKLAAWPPLPIQTGDQDDNFCFIDETTMEGDGVGESYQCSKCRDSENANKRKDIIDPLNRRYNYGKRRVLNYSMWSARGRGQQIRIN